MKLFYSGLLKPKESLLLYHRQNSLASQDVYKRQDRNGCFSENTFEAALGCFNHGADGLLLLDLSETDQDHDAAVACQKKICRKLDLPLYLGGHLKRLEDVKKYLYTGAAGVLGLPGDEQVCQEGAERFGKEKVRMLPELCCAANFDGVRLQAEDEPEFIFLSVSPETRCV